MIRLREFNMAELEYFIDPEEEINHDFSMWEDIEFSLIPDNSDEVSISLFEAVKSGIVRHSTVGYFMGMTYEFLTKM